MYGHVTPFPNGRAEDGAVALMPFLTSRRFLELPSPVDVLLMTGAREGASVVPGSRGNLSLIWISVSTLKLEAEGPGAAALPRRSSGVWLPAPRVSLGSWVSPCSARVSPHERHGGRGTGFFRKTRGKRRVGIHSDNGQRLPGLDPGHQESPS